MTRNRGRWALLALLVLGLGTGAGLWQLGAVWSGREVERRLRAQLTANSELVLGPLEVRVSPWHDFPHLTASVRHLALTDTAHGRAVPVLTIARADLRLNLRDVWERHLTVSRLEITGVVLRAEVDSAGRAWGLRGRRARRNGPGVAPAVTLEFDSIIVRDVALYASNAFTRNGLAGRCACAGGWRANSWSCATATGRYCAASRCKPRWATPTTLRPGAGSSGPAPLPCCGPIPWP